MSCDGEQVVRRTTCDSNSRSHHQEPHANGKSIPSIWTRWSRWSSRSFLTSVVAKLERLSKSFPSPELRYRALEVQSDFLAAFLSVAVISATSSPEHILGGPVPYPDLTPDRTSPENDVGPLPHSCPSCTSVTIVTTGRVPSIKTDCRCLGRDEIWTPARRQTQTCARWRP